MDDASAITKLLQGDTDLALQTATIPIPYSIEDARRFLCSADPQNTYAIVVGNELVGITGMLAGTEPVEIGYWIGRIYWRRGYATYAVALLLEEARKRGIRRVAAEVFPDNPASMRVLEKSGFLRVGEAQKDLPQRGGLRTVVRFQSELSGE